MKSATENVTRAGSTALTEDPAVTAALAALKTYDAGSGRATLLPIDAAVRASLSDSRQRAALEQRLVKLLSSGLPVVASDYVCAKLALIGGEACIPILVSLLGDVARSGAARNALQSIPGEKSAAALRSSLEKQRGLERIGVIQSLGWRRDAGSVRTLTALLKQDDAATTAAVLAALGEIGDARAARALRDYEPRCPAELRGPLGDACLVCAERLRAEGHRSEAEALLRILNRPDFPKHIRAAAERELKAASADARH